MAVEFDEDTTDQRFWELLKNHAGGVPGQNDTWKGKTQWSTREGKSADCVGIHIGNSETLRLNIKSAESQPSEERAARMRHYSWMIRESIGDQQLGDDLERSSSKGTSITVERPWARDDEDEWPDATQWIKEQCDRLHAIISAYEEANTD